MTDPASIDRYVVLGHPVAHSQSPFIHGEFARQTGHAIEYGRLLCPLDGFDDALHAFGAAGGRGCNVTAPFKFDACRLATRRSPKAELAQAANTLMREGDGWFGTNTDGDGLVRDLESNAGVALTGRRILLIGAGGAGAGVLGSLLQARPVELVLTNRSLDKALDLAQRHQALAHECSVALSVAPLQAPGVDFDVVINASASSLHGAASPVPGTTLRRGALAVDLMYGAASRPFLEWAQQHEATARDGLGMLVEQAALAFSLWRGIQPQTAPVLAALRRRLEAAS
jgi:shikimate dehydrogenase